MKRLLSMMVVLSLAMTFGFGQVIDDFETDIGNWEDPNYSGSTSGVDASSSFTVSTEQAYNGSSSGKVDLIDDAGVSGGYFVRMTNRDDQIAPDSKIGFWVYTATQDVDFRLVIWDNGTGGDGYEAGPYWTVAAANTWEYFELDLAVDTVTAWLTGNGAINSTDYVTIESIQFNTTTDADAVFYIDDVTETPFVQNYNVTFSVNMNFQIDAGNFVVGSDFVDVAGTLNGWAGGDVLSDTDADGIYEGTFSVAEGALEYKFRINGTQWENVSNRTATITGDTVLDTVWFDDQEPVPTVNVEVLLQCDMSVQILAGNFDPATDLIVVRGGHDNYGNWGGAVAMALDPEQTNVYILANQFDNVPVGSGYEYKFVILPGGDENAAVWESSPNRSWTATGDEQDTDANGYGEIIQPVAYFADVSPDDIVTQDVTVTFSVNLYSAYTALMNGDTLIDTQTGSDDITDWAEVNGVNINGILGQWWDWGNDLTSTGEWAMTATADPYIYTFDYLFTAGQAKVQTYKYGINSLDNEAGFAQNRELTIDDAGSTFAAPEDCFGSQNTDENLPFPQSCEPALEVSIHDIQFNDSTVGDGCYDSPYLGQTVTTTGIVSAYNGSSKAFIQDPAGAWNGVYMYQPGVDLQVGDSVSVNADVTEYYGYTELYPVNSITILGSTAVPDPALIAPGNLAGGCSAEAEAYEGVLVTMENVTVVGEANNYGEWWISDGTDTCQVEDTFMDFEPALGTTIASITGTVEYGFGEYALVPRDTADIVVGPASFNVTFSVNMNFQIESGNFMPDSGDFVDVAGTLNGWAGGDILADDDADGIYEGTFPVDAGALEYKFRINGSQWENVDNRTADITGDTVLPTVWFDNQEPVDLVNVEVLLQCDMSVQILAGNFDPATDLIVVRGGHDNYGNWGGAVAMALDPEQTNVYILANQFDNVPVGSGYEYKFVILPGGDENAAVWESSPNRSWTATGDEEDTDANGYGEIIQPVEYFGDVGPDDIVTQDVTVTFTVDISPAYWALSHGDTLIDTQTGSDDITDWSEVNGVNINGILGQWWDWGNDLTSTGEWAASATSDWYLFSYDYLFTAGQAKIQTYKYGINSLDNEAGFAQNREVTIDDASSTYAAPTDCFGDQNSDENLPFPIPCDGTSVADDPGIPAEFGLSQNYPNPFNPTTSIRFAMPEAGQVNLIIFNALGQQVTTLASGYQPAGYHTVNWDGTSASGDQVPSGLYIYTLTTADQSFSKKMLMLK